MTDIAPPSLPPDQAATPQAAPPQATPPQAAPPQAATPQAPPVDPWASFKPVEGIDESTANDMVEFVKTHKGGPEMAAALMKMEVEADAAEEEEFKQLSQKGWLEELQKDPVLGGAKTRETMVDAMRAFDRLDPAMQAVIREQGILYNPIVVRLLHHFGTGFREDSHVRPGATPAPRQAMSADDMLIQMFTPKK